MRQSPLHPYSPSFLHEQQTKRRARLQTPIHPSIHPFDPLFLFHFPCFFPFPPSPSKAFLANSALFSLFPPFNNSKCPARLAKLFSVNAVMPDECFFLNCAVLSAEELLLGLMMRAPSCLRLGLLFILERREEEDVSFLIFGEVFWGRGGDCLRFCGWRFGFFELALSHCFLW